MAPSSVRTTSAPACRQRATVSACGNPKRLPAPTLTAAQRGRTAATNGGVELVRLPWWGTLTTSADRARPPASAAASPAASTSPGKSQAVAPKVTRSTSEASFSVSSPSAPPTASNRTPARSQAWPGRSRCGAGRPARAPRASSVSSASPVSSRSTGNAAATLASPRT